MRYMQYEYGDPSGGGENAILQVPVWAQAPDRLTFLVEPNDVVMFELESEDGKPIDQPELEF